MNEPIVINTTEALEYKQVEESWTYEQMLELFPENNNLVNPLVRRCQFLESKVEQLQQQLKTQND